MRNRTTQTSDGACAPLQDVLALARGLAADRGFAIESAVSIAKIPSQSSARGVFKLCLDDGSCIKARVFEEASMAAAVAGLAALLEPAWAAQLLAHRGRVILTEWIVGIPPLDPRASREAMRDMARLHARLHGVGPLPRPTQHACVNFVKWQTLLAEWLAVLQHLGALTGAECSRVLEHGAVPPRTARSVISHGDLCRDNLIRREDATLCLVDYDTLTLAPVEFDLVRTFYRSEFDGAQQRRYQAHYEAADERPHFDPGAFSWWEPVVWAQSAQYRLRAGAADWERPVSLLKSV